MRTADCGYGLLALAAACATPALFRRRSGWWTFAAALAVACVGFAWGELFREDRYTFAVEGGDFETLTVCSRVCRRIRPKNMREIRLLEGYRPARRTAVNWRRGEYVWLPLVRRRKIDGRERRVPELVAGLVAGPKDLQLSDGRGLFQNRGSNEGRRRLLAFVPRGDNRGPFLQLLRQTDCPVIVSEALYRRERHRIDALLRRAGLDVSRLTVVLESETRA